MERGNIIPFRVNETEKQLLKRLAERDGLTVSSLLRVLIHKEARRYGIETTRENEDEKDHG